MNLGIVQITSHLKSGDGRYKLLCERSIKGCIESSEDYVLVSPPNSDLEGYTNEMGGIFSPYFAWERDMSHKWRQGISHLKNDWVGFFADDVFPDELWKNKMSKFLENKKPGQYGFRLTNDLGERHEHGEDWMQFPSMSLQLPHRPLDYNVETGVVEDSPTAYVANSIVHRDVLEQVEPFGLFGNAPDVMWSFAIRKCGFPIGFNPKARAYHVGDRKDNRKK